MVKLTIVLGIMGIFGSGLLAQANPQSGLIGGLLSGGLAVGAILLNLRHSQDTAKHMGARDEFVSKDFCRGETSRIARQSKLIIKMLVSSQGGKISKDVLDAAKEEINGD